MPYIRRDSGRRESLLLCRIEGKTLVVDVFPTRRHTPKIKERS